MKLNRWFVVGILAFLVVMFIVEMQLPKNFVWEPTFRHADKQPFGCCLFDSLMQTTIPEGYRVTDSSLYLLAQDTVTRRGILVVADQLELTEVDIEGVMRLASGGSHVMLVSHTLCDSLCDTLGITMLGYGESFDLNSYIKYNKERYDIFWESDTLGFRPRKYSVFGPICTRRFRFLERAVSQKSVLEEGNDSLVEVNRSIDAQATNRGDYVSATFPISDGYITYVCVPLLFTNYGVIDQDNVGFSLRLLSLMKDLPVVRTEAYCPTLNTIEQSPLRYFLSQPPLRWAIYLTILGALLFLFLGGRRRQRVIPIEKEPENRSLEFIRLVGTLYYHSRERRSLVARKFIYFAEEVRRNVHLDVTDASEDDVTLPTLAHQTGMEEAEMRNLILSLRQLVADDEETEISRKQMKYYIDRMNEIIGRI